MNTENKNTMANMKALLKIVEERIAEIEANKSVPTILGLAWTISLEGRPDALIHMVNQTQDQTKFCFNGTWNRDSVYWTAEKAKMIKDELQTEVEGKLYMMHHDDARDLQLEKLQEVKGKLTRVLDIAKS
jgi:hypothetical protein